MGYKYKYRQTLPFLKNKYPENLFFCKKKIKKYNHLFEENSWIIKKTKKNLLHCSFQEYQKRILYKANEKSEMKEWKDSSIFIDEKTVKNHSNNRKEKRIPSYLKEFLSKFIIKKNLILFTYDQLGSKLLFEHRGYKRFSNFFEKLREKKKLKILYGYINKKYLKKRRLESKKYFGRLETVWQFRFEYNLNFLLCRLGFYSNVRKAEQMIKHHHFLLNNKKIYSSHRSIERGDVLSVKKKSPKVPSLSKVQNNQWTFLYKKLTFFKNKLKYRFYCTYPLVSQPKTYYLLQKFQNRYGYC